MKRAALALALAVLGGCASMDAPGSATVTFVPIGDSYTIGTGVDPARAWPSLLAEHLTREGVEVRLLENPARNGWTSGDAVEGQLPVFRRLRPTFSTLLVGANDIVQGVDREVFRANLVALMDAQREIVGPGRLIVITVPDFTVTPYGSQFGGNAKILEFNAVIREEAEARGLPVVDLFAQSEDMRRNASLIARDGLHPSEAGHEAWEALVYPVALSLLKSST